MNRAPYAADPESTRGRLYEEAPSPTRTEFQRDRDRVVHSTAFRRLKDKTQVFLFDEGDHYRTRLTHTIEVAQIARALARALQLDEDLAEALALAHDLGHPPFGHAGERALGHAMAGHGGFDHNAQSLRVVTHLERRYPRYDGLNLAWETLEGLVKHNGPLTDLAGRPFIRAGESSLPVAIAEYAGCQDLMLSTHASGEAQAAAIADDIAYDTHDVDDGLRAGLLSLAALADLPLVGDILREIHVEHPGLAEERVRAEVVRRMITAMVEDVIIESRRRIAALAPNSADDIRHVGRPVVGFSEAMLAADTAIKALLRHDVYRNAEVMDVMERAEDVVSKLFARYRETPQALPEQWRPGEGDDASRMIADFLAGMTDRYAVLEYQRFFGGAPDLRGAMPGSQFSQRRD